MLTRRDVVALLDAHGLEPSRALGQNFVVDPNTIRKVVDLAGVAPGDAVVEIGAGLGSLTTALVDAGADVTAVELDQHLVPVLRDVLAGTDARIVQADAREVDWGELLAGRERWSLVANLPYNIATPLVADLLDDVPQIERMLVMVQREAAERLAASPGTKAYGIPSVKVAYWATAEVVARVSPNVFLPRPKVESALVRVVRRPEPPTAADPDRLFALVRAGFGQRRKMLRRSLSGLVGAEAFERAGVAPESRAEALDVEAWGRLALAAP
ncbi:MAG: 16S rRNA (adenine(1518)-N(6)/adenine(1519)-N(6))-dimethyltransferase RsmA [Microthrixaceae bacterium]|nr:16S rRNA (adenine(1518)-N(6)/adenine(1519)-N(6))-dimethyltransferase RsmA [Microthrixaceae bacterium]